ncbi:pentatricopeptide repeat-containing protein At5g03800 [Prosopis cineraria]|uniref:pentatricopeptide repeat-containing protein At5g03800 n=1 Tax=Prosopis cineraria TaxID=364024 RepID=UPI00240FFD67|nr:pentatricopeptide repeat-containing protein At5g03800 [Prosopis cineraria]
MATVLDSNCFTHCTQSSPCRFIRSPSLSHNFFNCTLKLKPPPRPLTSRLHSPATTLLTPLFKNSKFRHALHSSASPIYFLQTPQTSVSDSNPPLFSEASGDGDSIVDGLFKLLRISARYGDAELARAAHASVVKLEEDTYLGNALIVAYLKLGLFSDAYNVFFGLSSPDVVSYTALISGFSKSNREEAAFELFLRMRDSGIEPNEYSFVAILTACIRIMHVHLGLQIHNIAIKMGFLDCVFVANALMGLYSKCGYYDVVLKLFGEMRERDIASWNTVISGAVKESRHDTPLQLFRDMQQNDGLKIDYFTLSTLLIACVESVAVMEGQQVHAHAIKSGLESNLSVGNTLIRFYTKCGTLDDVVSVFDRMTVRDVITWTEIVTAYMEFGLVNSALRIFDEMPEKNPVSYNALLSGFCQNGEGLKALHLFLKMVEDNLELTDFSLTSIISACSLLADYRVSKQIHGFVLKFGFGPNVFIETALLDMYTRCGRMEEAKNMFCRLWLKEGNTVAWTSMICGYARNGQPDEAISLIQLGQLEGKTIMDEFALSAMLGLCGVIGCHELGKQIHCHVIKLGFEFDVGVGNAIISMYFKCWNVDDAIKMFYNMPKTDIVSWNALITGHILHRLGDRALEIWSNMQKECIKPDEVTFVLVISAYTLSNLNLVDDCRGLFHSMRTIYGIEPTSEHYASFISVLGYWGRLEEAEETINKMPFEPAASVWRTLLDSCRLHKNTIIGKQVVKKILALEPKDPSTNILVANLYSASGRWHCSEVIRENMRQSGFRKHPAQSWIISHKKMHSFYARDRSHPQAKDIYRGLEILILECMKVGYVPDTSFVLHEVEEYQKKDFLFHHSAKLAATYGLLTRKHGKPIRIVKNILLCGDCHTFLKYVSIVTRRDIFLRDSSGFHYFSGGLCSCKDYW